MIREEALPSESRSSGGLFAALRFLRLAIPWSVCVSSPFGRRCVTDGSSCFKDAVVTTVPMIQALHVNTSGRTMYTKSPTLDGLCGLVKRLDVSQYSD